MGIVAMPLGLKWNDNLDGYRVMTSFRNEDQRFLGEKKARNRSPLNQKKVKVECMRSMNCVKRIVIHSFLNIPNYFYPIKIFNSGGNGFK